MSVLEDGLALYFCLDFHVLAQRRVSRGPSSAQLDGCFVSHKTWMYSELIRGEPGNCRFEVSCLDSA